MTRHRLSLFSASVLLAFLALYSVSSVHSASDGVNALESKAQDLEGEVEELKSQIEELERQLRWGR